MNPAGKGHPAEKGVAKPKRLNRWWIVAIGALGIAGVYWAVSGKSDAVVVTLAEAQLAPLQASFTAEGVVIGKQYSLSPANAGRVSWVGIAEGDTVVPRQVLLRLDNSELTASLRQAIAAKDMAEAQVREAVHARRLAESAISGRISVARAKVRDAESRLALIARGTRAELIAQAEHQIEKSRALVEEARRSLQRAERLYNEGALARASYEAAQTRFEATVADLAALEDSLSLLKAGPLEEERASAKSMLDAAEAELKAALEGQRELAVREAAIKGARARLSEATAAVSRVNAGLKNCEVSSPVKGTVTRLNCEVGVIATPGMPALEIATREDMHIDAEIVTEDLPKTKVGMSVVVTSAGYPGKRFTGRIARLSQTGELKQDAAIRTRIVRARILLDNGWGGFTPGMEVDVEGETTLGKAITVPSDSLIIDEQGTGVWVVNQGIVKRRPVVLGYSSPTATEIVQGLKGGEFVVVEGKSNLRDGQTVQVTK